MDESRAQAGENKDPWTSLARLYGIQEHMERPSIDALVTIAQARASDSVIDLATGTGMVPRALAPATEIPQRLIGIDQSRAMLDRAGPMPHGWTLIAGDAIKTGLSTGSATLVTCAWFLHLLTTDQQMAALREIRRLLTVDGRAVVVVPSGASPRGRARIAAPITRFIAKRRGLKVLRPITNLEALFASAELLIDADVTTRDGWPARILLARPLPVSGRAKRET